MNTAAPPLLPEAAAARLLAGDLGLLKQGLQKGLRLDARWPHWECPLLHGVCLFAPPQASEMVSALLTAGADMGATYRGLSPMLCALGGFNRESGDPLGARLAVVKALHMADPSPQMALWAMSAARVGYKEAVGYFLDNGCDPDAFLEGGHTMLHDAYARKDGEMGNFLVTRGASTTARNAAGKRPSEINSMDSDLVGAATRANLEALDLSIEVKEAGNVSDGRSLRL